MITDTQRAIQEPVCNNKETKNPVSEAETRKHETEKRKRKVEDEERKVEDEERKKKKQKAGHNSSEDSGEAGNIADTAPPSIVERSMPCAKEGQACPQAKEVASRYSPDTPC